MTMRGAGGTPGGAGRFFLGLAMMIAGGYLFLSSIRVYNLFSFGYGLFSMGGLRVTSGMTLLPLVLGIGLIFSNSGSILGWLLAAGSLIAICVGVIASIQFSLAGMSLFELLVIFVMLAGGAGLFFSSLRDSGGRGRA